MRGRRLRKVEFRRLDGAARPADKPSHQRHNEFQTDCGSDELVIISSIELREIRLLLIHFFETSFGRTTERRIILVRVTDADGVEGWGECTAGEGPFYSEEWTETAWPTLKEFLAPMVVGQRVEDAAGVNTLMKKVR